MRSYDLAELVTRKIESDELDYKSAMSWRDMTRQEKGKILRHLTAFANTRGGYLVIGVGEDASGVPAVYTGLTGEQAAGFDPTAVGNFINAHVEPPIDYTIERPIVNGKQYVVFIVRPFKSLPHVCSRGVEGELQEGIFYIRTPEASSRPARRVHEMQNLIRRCMRNEREQLGRILRGILYESSNHPRNGGNETGTLSDMLADAENYFRHRQGSNRTGVMLKFTIIPETAPSVLLTAEKLQELMQKSVWQCSDPQFLSNGEVTHGQETPGSLRFLSQNRPLMWQIFDRGAFAYFRYTDKQNMTLEELAKFCAETVSFAGKSGEELNWSEELLNLQISIIPTPGAMFDEKYISEDREISAEIRRSVADLNSGRENHAARLLRRLGEELRIPDKQIDAFQAPIKAFLERR